MRTVKEGRSVKERRRVFTSRNVALMKQMASQGLSAREIAKALNSTPGSVRVTCSNQGIRLKRGRGSAAEPRPRSTAAAEHVSQVPIVAYMSFDLYEKFSSKAKALREPVTAFASQLLEATTSDLCGAVLEN